MIVIELFLSSWSKANNFWVTFSRKLIGKVHSEIWRFSRRITCLNVKKVLRLTEEKNHSKKFIPVEEDILLNLSSTSYSQIKSYAYKWVRLSLNKYLCIKRLMKPVQLLKRSDRKLKNMIFLIKYFGHELKEHYLC